MTKDELLSVETDVVVGLSYELRLADGQLVDQSAENEPLHYLHGHGNIISGLETALTGLRLGDAKSVSVAPADGYGDYDPEDRQKYPRSAFPKEFTFEEGMPLRMVDHESGDSYEAFIAGIEPDAVWLDFNHPLAGQTLNFNISIVSLRTASADEKAHGHVH